MLSVIFTNYSHSGVLKRLQVLIIVVINSSLLLKHDIPGKTSTCTCTS